MNLEKYYEQAHSGKIVDNTEILTYIKSFKRVVLWGGSYLGVAIGRYLLENGVAITNYWDLRKDELKEVNGIEVILPFDHIAIEETLVIFCIGNNVIRGGLLAQLAQNGYTHVIRGDYLYMGAVCPFNLDTGIRSEICQGTMCCRSIFCQRLSSIVQKAANTDASKEAPLHTFSITLIVNQKCSLKCMCCTSYMNEYPKEKKVNFPFERICQDIDKFFDAMDSVGTVTVMGGEPFMHPQISDIILKLLEKKNFGLISIATTGTYPIKDEQLIGLADPRVNVSFSNYGDSLTNAQLNLMYKNIDLIKSKGISYTVGVAMPVWSVPSTLYDLGDDEATMIQKKTHCIQPPRCMQIKNGKLHPCDFGTAVYSLGIADYPSDYVDIEHSRSTEELRQQIRAYIDQPYYQVCGHCAGMQGITSKAAEQGYLDFKKPLPASISKAE